MTEDRIPTPPIPESKVVARNRSWLSPIWIIPVLAAVVGIWVGINTLRSQGPEITIVFRSADGLDAGKTKIRFKGVDVGTLTKIRLSANHRKVIATAQMSPGTESFLVQDTKFWVVRPRISGANVTGLGTLISGAYIGMEIGGKRKSRTNFIALEQPPVVSGGVPGRFFILDTPDLGSLDVGTPVFFRHLQVGEVASYKLDRDGRLFHVEVFVKTPYDRFVTTNTRFWQASGINMQLTANGLSIQTQSLMSILVGGVAFETYSGADPAPVARAGKVFTLYANRTQAFEPPPRHPQTYELIFKGSVRGLQPGAPVEFRGIKVGEVKDVRAQVDTKTMKFSAPVTIQLDPQRLGVRVMELKPGESFESVRRRLINSLVAHGVRAQLQTGNLLTGATFVAFDFFPGAPPAKVDWSQKPVQLPTVPGSLQTLEARLQNIVKKLNRMPLEGISKQLLVDLVTLNQTLQGARGTLASARNTMDNANQYVRPDSVSAQELYSTLKEVRSAARSLRVLADYLERHPEALLRGKRTEAK